MAGPEVLCCSRDDGEGLAQCLLQGSASVGSILLIREMMLEWPVELDWCWCWCVGAVGADVLVFLVYGARVWGSKAKETASGREIQCSFPSESHESQITEATNMVVTDGERKVLFLEVVHLDKLSSVGRYIGEYQFRNI